MKEFTDESQRYDYTLTESSLVLDVGAYKGEFANSVERRYGCKVWMFEPIFEFPLLYSSKLIWFRCAVGARSGIERFGVGDDWTGKYLADDKHEKRIVPVLGISDVMCDISHVDLLKLNVEGMEYEILEEMWNADIYEKFGNIQVQFHQNVPDFQERYENIAVALRHSHELEWRTPFIWESWKLKK